MPCQTGSQDKKTVSSSSGVCGYSGRQMELHGTGKSIQDYTDYNAGKGPVHSVQGVVGSRICTGLILRLGLGSCPWQVVVGNCMIVAET